MKNEKYCSNCSKLIKNDVEICPECNVEQVPILNDKGNSKSYDDKKSTKFLLSCGASFITILIVVYIAINELILFHLDSSILALLFSLVVGIIGIAIPTRKKIIYIPISLLVTSIITGFIISLL